MGARTVFFWDLGLTPKERAQLILHFPRVTVRTFPYGSTTPRCGSAASPRPTRSSVRARMGLSADGPIPTPCECSAPRHTFSRARTSLVASPHSTPRKPRPADSSPTGRHARRMRGASQPPRSDRTNHRQDQAVLSVLAHMAGLAPRGSRGIHVRDIGVRFHQGVVSTADVAHHRSES